MQESRHLDPTLLPQLQQWNGRTETLRDEVTPTPLRALAATLDRDDPDPVPGTPLPFLWHWLFGFFCRTTGKARSGPMAMPSVAVFCRRSRCPGACGQAGD